jgi:hypothetical protein
MPSGYRYVKRLTCLLLFALAACGSKQATQGSPSPPTAIATQTPISSAVGSPSCHPVSAPNGIGAPSPRESAGMVYDATQKNVLIFGGDHTTDRKILGDTWTWDGTSWTERHPSSSPSPRTRMAIAYDQVHQVVVLFGGTDRFLTVPGSANRSDTWIWDGTTWTQRQPAPAPSLAEAVMTFDESSRSVVLFGLQAAGGAPETWTWNGTAWKQAHPASSPAGRDGASLTYDASSHRVLLFGGFNQHDGNLNDTWAWDGSSWTEEHPAHAPLPRQQAAITRASDGLLLFSGIGAQGPPFGDTWRWNGRDWLLLQPCTVPSPRVDASVAYDSRTSVVVMFGGVVVPLGGTGGFSNETWLWDGTDWRPVT